MIRRPRSSAPENESNKKPEKLVAGISEPNDDNQQRRPSSSSARSDAGWAEREGARDNYLAYY